MRIMAEKKFLDKILFFFFLFIVLQELSLIGYLYPLWNKVFFCLFLALTIFLTYKNQNYGWLILLFELFAGHGGQLFSWMISLRLAIFIIVFGFWLFRKVQGLFIKKRQFQFSGASAPAFILLVFLIFIFFGLIQGLINNNIHLAIGDFINYSYWFLIFPLFEFFKEKENQKNFLALFIGCLFGLSFLTLIIFIFFSQGIVEVHDVFYWWWRNIATGKATAMNDNFFRIVTPAHLLIPSIFLLLISLYSQKKYRKWTIPLMVALSFPFLVNFSRIYWLGFLIGLLVLGLRKPIKKNLKISFLIFILLVLEFGVIYFLTSKGQSFGLDFFGDRLKTTVNPEEELSALTRLRILPNLLENIAEYPIFGRGLGAEVSYFDPVENNLKTTYHLDWGFLEMWLELGFLGLISFFLVLGEIFYLLIKSRKENKEKEIFFWGLITGVLSLLISSLTGPFIFHSLGVIYLVLVFIYGVRCCPNSDLSKS